MYPRQLKQCMSKNTVLYDLKYSFGSEKLREKIKQCVVKKLPAYETIQVEPVDEDYNWYEIDDALLDDSQLYEQ